MKKILILGCGRSGKDTLAELLQKYYGFSYKSSSEISNELFIFDKIKDKFGYKSLEECFNDRFNHRDIWYDMICEYNKYDKSRLSKEILKKYDCYVGMRDLDEFEASKHLFDVIIYVDANKRVKEVEDTNKIDIDLAHFIMTNNKTLEDFETKVKTVGNLLIC